MPIKYVEFESANPEQKDEELLQRIQEKIFSVSRFEEVMESLWIITQEFIPHDRIGLAFIEEDGQSIVARYAKSNLDTCLITDGYSSGLANSSLEIVLKSGKARIINNLAEYIISKPDSDSSSLLLQEGIRSSLTVPLIIAGRAIGFLFFSSQTPGIFTEKHAELLNKLTLIISHTVEKAWLNHSLEAARKKYATMVGFVAHEMKSPLSTAMSLGYAYMDGVYGEVDKQAAMVVGKMLRISGYLVNMTGNYLDLARLDSGEMRFKPDEDVPFRKGILDFALDIVQSRIDEFNSTVNVDIEPDEIYLECDPELIKIVLINLFDNAVKYGDENGKVDIEIKLQKSQLLIKVTNEGVGFTEEQAKGLFKKFSRLRQAGLEDRRGTGLGLYLSWWIVQKHRGRIEAKSEYGKWASFHVVLPNASPIAINS